MWAHITTCLKCYATLWVEAPHGEWQPCPVWWSLICWKWRSTVFSFSPDLWEILWFHEILWMGPFIFISILWGYLFFCEISLMSWVGWNRYMGKCRPSKVGFLQCKRTIWSCQDKLFTCNSRIEIMKCIEHCWDSRKTRVNFIITNWDHVMIGCLKVFYAYAENRFTS